MNHEHNWVDVPVSFKGEVFGMEYQVSVKHCTICSLYDHTISLAGYSYEYLAMTAAPGVEGIIQNLALKLYCSIFGENATAEKAPSGIGRKDLPGYADDNGTPSVSSDGSIIWQPTWDDVIEDSLTIYYSYNWRGYLVDGYALKGFFTSDPYDTGTYIFTYKKGTSDAVVSVSSKNSSNPSSITTQGFQRTSLSFLAPIKGKYNLLASPYVYYSVSEKTYTYTASTSETVIDVGAKLSPSEKDISWNSTPYSSPNFYWHIYLPKYKIVPYSAADKPTSSTNITINNNTWNGNIYTDNSTNLTYIYPQYTTINEKNETVTNISNTPIIYNNETKKYYTYDTVTNNYYYITYEQPATPTPSPSPSPAPTETPSPSESPAPTPTSTPKPGGSISTPETGKPGGDTGDTTGILAVLVEIRDNMIQGFLDIKAAFVAGFAELSANFTLAIENLNVNIQNIFNKKFPDQSTPETALPSPTPSPSPAPLDPILPETQNLIIPKMNSNTFTDEHGTWIASGSSKYSDVFDFFHAFDRSTSDFWETNVSPSYLQIEIPDPENYYIDGYIMRISKFDNRYPKGWTLQGSDDGETWDDLDTQAGQNLSDKAEHKYTLTLRKAYKYYRMNMSNYASSMCSLSHFNLLGYDAKDVITPTPSPSPTPDPGETPTPTPAPTDKPSNGNTNNFWNFVFPGGSDDGTENGHKGILWALISLLIAVVTFVLGLGSAYSYVFPFLPAGLVTTIHICVLVLLLFAIIKFVRSFL